MNNINNSKRFQIGEIYLINFDGTESVQKGLRPGLIFQNNTGNLYSPNVIALPLTSSVKKSEQPTHVLISAESSGLLRDSMVLCENPCCIPKSRVGKYLTTLPEHLMEKVAIGSLLASSAVAFVNPELLIAIQKKAAKLNSVA